MTGESHFSEVFLTDVEIPVDNLLGGPDALNQVGARRSTRWRTSGR
jgi:alkylation response protein AidB-like acyl-CoA dehydrogenase